MDFSGCEFNVVGLGNINTKNKEYKQSWVSLLTTAVPTKTDSDVYVVYNC